MARLKRNSGVVTAQTLEDARMDWRHFYIVIVSLMEQLTGASMSTIVGIIIPLLNMFMHPEISSVVQGLMGATGLTAIAIGSLVVGRLMDRYGYLRFFRLCAVMEIAGSVLILLFADVVTICVGLFVAGLGIGGGYCLDSAYISELMPDKWRNFMVGVAKASSALGFILPAIVTVLVLKIFPSAEVWRVVVSVMLFLGVLTLFMRLRWAESPAWLLTKGRIADAQKAARVFFGSSVEISADNVDVNNVNVKRNVSLRAFFTGKNVLKVIYTGIPWACEGIGVYGIGVFLPVLIMALGLDHSGAEGIGKVIKSVELTAVVNFCILPGFIIGLLVMNRMRKRTMLWGGFLGSSLGLALLLCAYCFSWPMWVSVLGFMLFEVMLNAGPHLVTYIIPTEVYDVDDRGLGNGVAGFLGKLGAILGVFFMPVWLKSGGIVLVLEITIGVMIAGGIIGFVFGRYVKH